MGVELTGAVKLELVLNVHLPNVVGENGRYVHAVGCVTSCEDSKKKNPSN